MCSQGIPAGVGGWDLGVRLGKCQGQGFVMGSVRKSALWLVVGDTGLGQKKMSQCREASKGISAG